MSDFAPSFAGSWFALAGLCVSTAVLVYALLGSASASRYLRAYGRHLDGYYDFLFIERDAKRDAAFLLGGALAMVVVALLLDRWMLLALPPLAFAALQFHFDKQVLKKRDQMSEQLPPWLTVLSNSLRSSPNITDALATSIGLTTSPLREEVDLLIKEVQLGEHLDRAMQRSSTRVGSPLYSSVMTTLLVGRRSGGDLSAILEGSSDTLREMERLAGVVRTKTAEGRAQTTVMAVLPLGLVLILGKVDPTLMPKLLSNFIGHILLGISGCLWLGAVLLARRIVKVDI